MDWSNERYVRVYVRDTTSWIMLGWEAQALYLLILRKVDRAGILELGKTSRRNGGVDGVAALVGMPRDVVDRCLPVLLEDGCLESSSDGTALVVPNFIEAQEASMSPAARQQQSRLKRRDLIRVGLDPDLRETVIYFIQSENGGPIKIGRAEDLAKRLIGLQTGRPDKLVVLAAFPGSIRDERVVQNRFAHLREKGEWFNPADELVEYIRSIAVAKGDGSQGVTDRSRPVTGHADRALGDRSLRAVPCRTVPSEREEVLSGWQAISKQKQRVLSKHLPSVQRLWALQERLRAESLPRARTLHPTAERLSAVAERLEAGATEGECELVLAHYAAEAKRTDGRWFNGETNWRPSNFTRALGQTGGVNGSHKSGGQRASEVLDAIADEREEKEHR